MSEKKYNYAPVYKCLMCNESVYPVRRGIRTTESGAIKMNQDIFWGLLRDDAHPKQIYHKCAGGSIGSALFIGMYKFPENDTTFEVDKD